MPHQFSEAQAGVRRAQAECGSETAPGRQQLRGSLRVWYTDDVGNVSSGICGSFVLRGQRGTWSVTLAAPC